jgi:hypothetical protein
LFSHPYLKKDKLKYANIILPVVVYGCEARSLTFGEECGPRNFEAMMLRKIFRPKGREFMGGWRNLRTEEVYDTYPSPYIIRAVKNQAG